MGKDVYNDKNEKVGVVDDLIITPEKAVSYAIVGTGGFLWNGQARCGHSRKSVQAGGWQDHFAGCHQGSSQGHARSFTTQSRKAGALQPGSISRVKR